MIKKRGQQTMSMPFGIIFAIFLIVVFVVIAFIAVSYFLDIGRASGVGMFYREFQDSVDEAMSGQFSEADFAIDLPDGVKQVCIANLSNAITNPGAAYDAIEIFDLYDANTFLVPTEYAEGMEWKLIERLDVEKITAEKNPYCVNVEAGFKIKKGFYDKLVIVE